MNHSTPMNTMAATTMDPHAGHNMGPMTGPEGGHPKSHPMGMHNMDMMKMYFHTGVDETVLFYRWKVTTVGEMMGSCVAIFLLALLYEGLKVFREYLLKTYNLQARFSSYNLSNGKSSQDSSAVMVDSSPRQSRHHFCTWSHFLQTFLHMVQVLVSYFLMLIFMTYNIWLCLAVLLGAGAGYLAFGWRRAIIVDVNDHCH